MKHVHMWILALVFALSAFAQPSTTVPKDPRWQTVGAGALASRPATCVANRSVYICNGAGCTTNGGYYYCTATNTWTFGGGAPVVDYSLFRTLCQNTVAGSNFSTPAANPPTFTCVTGANDGDASTAATAWNFGVLAFAENGALATSNSVQGAIPLPSTWVAASGITVDLVWRTGAIAGDVVWQIQGQCIADAQAPGDFGVPVLFTADTAKGTTLQWNNVAQKTLTTTDVLAGCAAGETFLFRFFRDATVLADTLVGAADLITARFGVTK